MLLLDTVGESVGLALSQRAALLSDHALHPVATVYLAHLARGYGPFKVSKTDEAMAIPGAKEELDRDGNPTGMVELPGAKLLMPGGPRRNPKQDTRVDPFDGLEVGGKNILNVADDPFELNMLRILLNLGEIPAGLADEFSAKINEATLAFWEDTELRGRVVRRISDFKADRAAGLPNCEMDILVSCLTYLSNRSKVQVHISAFRPDLIAWQDRLEDAIMVMGFSSLVVGLVAQQYYGKERQQNKPKAGVGIAEQICHLAGADDGRGEVASARQIRYVNLLLNLMIYHGLGNVSTFDALVSASGGNNPVQSTISMLEALAGLNHGGAGPWGGHFLFGLVEEVGGNLDASFDDLVAKAQDYRAKKLAIPNMGHRILRVKPDVPADEQIGDPRKAAGGRAIEEGDPDSEIAKFAFRWFGAASKVLGEEGKAAFPEPNVDATTALILHLVGLVDGQEDVGFAYLIFGLSRTWGASVATFWHGVHGNALMRPGEFDLDQLES